MLNPFIFTIKSGLNNFKVIGDYLSFKNEIKKLSGLDFVKKPFGFKDKNLIGDNVVVYADAGPLGLNRIHGKIGNGGILDLEGKKGYNKGFCIFSDNGNFTTFTINGDGKTFYVANNKDLFFKIDNFYKDIKSLLKNEGLPFEKLNEEDLDLKLLEDGEVKVIFLKS